jgi:hypothetical protein
LLTFQLQALLLMNILGFTRNTRKIGDFLLSLKEIVETGISRPHPYDMPINLWTPPKEAMA